MLGHMSPSATMKAHELDPEQFNRQPVATGACLRKPQALRVIHWRGLAAWALGAMLVGLLAALLNRLWAPPVLAGARDDHVEIVAMVSQQWARAQTARVAAALAAAQVPVDRTAHVPAHVLAHAPVHAPKQDELHSDAFDERYWQTLHTTTLQQTAWVVSALEAQDRGSQRESAMFPEQGVADHAARSQWLDAQLGLASRAQAWAARHSAASAPPVSATELAAQAQFAASASQRFLAHLEQQSVLRRHLEPALASVAVMLAVLGVALLWAGLRRPHSARPGTVPAETDNSAADLNVEDANLRRAPSTELFDITEPLAPRQVATSEQWLQHLVRAQHRAQGGAAPGFALIAVRVQIEPTTLDALGHGAHAELAAAIRRRLFDTLPTGAAVTPAWGKLLEPTDDLSAGVQCYWVLVEALFDSAEPGQAASSVAKQLHIEMSDAYTVLNHPLRGNVAVGLLAGHDIHQAAKAALPDLALALRNAVRQGGVVTFAVPMREARARELALHHGFVQAMLQHDFVPLYEPVTDLSSGRIAVINAEPVWMHGTRGALTLPDFVDDLLTAGCARSVSQHVCGLVFAHFSTWLGQWHELSGDEAPPRISVPLWPGLLQATDYFDTLMAGLAEYQLRPLNLELRLTQSAVMHDAEQACLVRLQSAGVHLALEGLGSASPSLQALHELPLATVCVGSGFVAQVVDLESHAMLVGAVARVAAPLGMQVRAQGVCTMVQRDLLAQLGVTQAQGEHFGGAMPAALFAAHMSDAQAAVA